MEPKIWGPPFWFVIHTIAFYYPENPTFNEKRHMFEYFQNLQYVIPCPICRRHYAKTFQEHPITPYLDSKNSLVEWTVNLHNIVNKSKGKPTKSLSEVIKHYEKVYSRNQFSCNAIKDQNDLEEWDTYSSTKNKKFYWHLLFILLLGFVGYSYLFKFKN